MRPFPHKRRNALRTVKRIRKRRVLRRDDKRHPATRNYARNSAPNCLPNNLLTSKNVAVKMIMPTTPNAHAA